MLVGPGERGFPDRPNDCKEDAMSKTCRSCAAGIMAVARPARIHGIPAFDALDSDGDGRLSRSEYAFAWNRLGDPHEGTI